ncbi:MAG: VWA domain-containing protein [Desulfobacterales bacterium]|nr:VWA domain-containing protein [Desulfobacterales bacterium]
MKFHWPLTFINPIFFGIWLLIPLIWVSLRSGLNRTSLIAGILRSLLVLILGLILSDPRLVTHSDRVNLFFCIDVSESIEEKRTNPAIAFMQKAAAGMKADDQAGLLIFGREPSVETDLKKNFEPNVIQSTVNRNFTNISGALQTAIGRLPNQGKNRIVLFSDGNENMENAVEAAWLANSLGIEIYTVPLPSWYSENEVFIEYLDTPTAVALETPFEIRLGIMSTSENRGELLILKNDSLLSTQQISLKPGKNIFKFKDILERQGLYLYKAVINVQKDTVHKNNENISFTKGTGKSTVLYLTSNEKADIPLVRALQTQGIDVAHKIIGKTSHAIHDLIEYSAVVIDNVPARAFSFADMENIRTYVRDMGGGLVMTGGNESFGAGRYGKTPVEKTLPVFMDAPATLKYPGLCLILVIDKSDSMTGTFHTQSKLEMAKIAAFSAVEILNPFDQVGILAFDSDFQWVVPITQVKERNQIALKLSTLEEEGGTALYPALAEASKALGEISAAKKHMIILSDGLTEQADFQTLISSMKESRITVSTVATGTGSDISLLTSIAQWSGGRSYYTDNAGNIPRIFTDETRIISTNVVIEKTMQPYTKTKGEIILGIQDDPWPVIHGQVAAHPKPGARVLIRTEQGPLLAAWQYGLGRSAAYTSDLSSMWGKDWILWDNYSKFASQMVKWVQRKKSLENVSAVIEKKGNTGILTADVTDNHKNFVNHLSLKARILAPSEADWSAISLDQVAPGRYRGVFPAEETGGYFVSLFNTESQGTYLSHAFGYGIPYSDEFNNRDTDEVLLKRLASITKGQFLSPDYRAENLFIAGQDARQSGTRLWPYLSFVFLCLFIADIALRQFYTGQR